MKKEEFLKKYDIVELTEKDGFFIDMKYSKKENFMNEILYNNGDCLIREGTFKKLKLANIELNKIGYCIKIWDAFRPIEVQRKMWDMIHDEKFVSDPNKDKINHCRASSVDVTLCDINGNELKMPTEFDHFGKESFRSEYNTLNKEIKNNVIILENIMKKYGFEAFLYEWWHFNDNDNYDIIYEYYE